MKHLKIPLLTAIALVSFAWSLQAELVEAKFNTAADVPLTANGYIATDKTLLLTLNFAPAVGTNLTVINNTNLPFIQGSFLNLAQGQAVDLSYDGTTYHFVANYYGGSGNDLVLQWAITRPLAWGSNSNGQLGNGTTANSPVPTAVNRTGVLLGKTILQISSNLILCSDSTVVSLGANNLNPVTVDSSGVLAGKTVVAVSGGYPNLALCSDGTVAAWGSSGNNDNSGALGNNSSTDSLVPVAVYTGGILAGKTVVAISSSTGHSVALCSDGTVVTWGTNLNGELGINSTVSSSVPVLVDTLGPLSGKTVVRVSAGAYHDIALCSDGTLLTWGYTNGTQSKAPVLVSPGVLSGKTIVAISAGNAFSIALSSEGTFGGWGDDSYYQLATTGSPFFKAPVSPGDFGNLTGKQVVGISAVGDHSLALCSDGVLLAWGKTDYGQLGSDDFYYGQQPIPVSSTGLTDGERFYSAVSGGQSNLALVAAMQIPSPPVIGSAGSASGTYNSVFAGYTITATNSPLSFGANNLPPGLSVNVSTGLISGTPSAAGVYTSSISATNTGGTTTAIVTFTIAKATATISFSGLTVTYDGTGKSAQVKVVPANVPVVQTYNGSSDLPGAPGSYALVATVNDPNYQGGASGTFVITSQGYALNASFNSATAVAVTSPSYFPSAAALVLNLTFPPAAGTNLTVIKNTGNKFIQGSFLNLVQGQKVSLMYQGSSYNFVANYFGGSGNDLVLQWAAVKPMGWGLNTQGQLGDGTTVNRLSPVEIGRTGVLVGKTILAEAAGMAHSLALCSDGSVASWGGNASGQLGDNSTTDSSAPVAVTLTGVLAGKTVIALAAGQNHSLALCSDGTVAAWGSNDFGQLGVSGSVVKSSVPVAISVSGALAGKTVVAIAAGQNHSLALCSDGTMFAWGANGSGQLGNNSTTGSSIPVAVTASGILAGKTVAAISAGGQHNLVLLSDGEVAAWGDNTYGQLGTANTAGSLVPVLFSGGFVLSKVAVSVSAGQSHSLVLCSDGTVAGCGRNQYGQLGDNTTTDRLYSVAMINSGSNGGVTAISAGQDNSILYKPVNQLNICGNNASGQLGNNGSGTQSSLLVYPNTSNLPLSSDSVLTRVGSGPTASHTLGLFALSVSKLSYPTAPKGILGFAFNYPLVASNSPTGFVPSNVPVGYVNGGLPGGLAIDSVTGVISGTPTQTGTFPVYVELTNAAGTYIDVFTITIAAPSPLDNFHVANGLALDGSQDFLSPAGDGVSNLAKFAFNMLGSDSGQAATLNIPNGQVMSPSGNAGLPVVQYIGANQIVLSYVRRKASTSPGVTYTVQFSNDLSTWSTVTPAYQSATSIDANFERVILIDNTTSEARRFCRVRVTSP